MVIKYLPSPDSTKYGRLVVSVTIDALSQSDFSSLESLEERVDRFFSQVVDPEFKAALDSGTILVDPSLQLSPHEMWRAIPKLLVFPETFGSWMLFSDEKFFCQSSQLRSILWLVVMYPVDLLQAFFTCFAFTRRLLESSPMTVSPHNASISPDRTTFPGILLKSLFFSQRHQMLFKYTSFFSRLAQKYDAWILGGSTFLPPLFSAVPQEEAKEEEEKSSQDRARTPLIGCLANGMLCNLSGLFDPLGHLRHVFYKRNLVPEEQPFLEPQSPSIDDDLLPLRSASDQHAEVKNFLGYDLASGLYQSTCDTGSNQLGSVCALICADSWFPDTFPAHGGDNSKDQLPTIVAVPSLISPAALLDQPWLGYSKGTIPPDDMSGVEPALFTERQAWMNFSIQGRDRAHDFAKVYSFFDGAIWGMQCQKIEQLLPRYAL